VACCFLCVLLVEDMYPLVTYCFFVVSTLGATSFPPVLSLSHDVISGDTSSTHPDEDGRPLVSDSHETGSDLPEDSDDSFSVSRDVIEKLDSPKPSDDQTVMSNHFKKPSTRANKAKFLLGRRLSSSHPQWSSFIDGAETAELSDHTWTEHDAKRQESRRHFKLGKKSLDRTAMLEHKEQETTVNKRKTIKFGKKSLSKESAGYLASA